ncbi:MAG: hypothetical protein NTX44_00380 [Ignavibacteriales bacterium]|nr:hypothetical protein [Ignavibacteriales bacterium]
MKEYQYCEQTLDNRKFAFVKINADILNNDAKQKEIFNVFRNHFTDFTIALILPTDKNKTYQMLAEPETTISGKLQLHIFDIVFSWKSIKL